MITAQDALLRLQEGNQRFVDGKHDCLFDQLCGRREELAGSQEPFAIVLGCSDSRVPVELIFNQGLGDLFVIRVAGNVIAPSLVGSVEFAASQFGTRLVVVLGHTNCGAVKATLESLKSKAGEASPNLNSIVKRVRPSVETLLETCLVDYPEQLLRAAVRANIRASVQQLRVSSHILENLALEGGLLVVGAEYDLETGVVEFLT